MIMPAAGRHPCPRLRRRVQHGVTLIELVIVIVIIGIIGATLGAFLASPIQAYFQTVARADLLDQGDLLVHRLTREIQGSVPNSLRSSTLANGSVFVEFVPIVDSGRYLQSASDNGLSNSLYPLDFTNPANSSFQVVGPGVSYPSGAYLTIMNAGSGSLNLYGGSNVRALTGSGANLGTVTYAGGTAWPSSSPNARFYLFTTAVSYVCIPGANGSGTVTRYYGYALQAAQPVSISAAPLSGASKSLMSAAVSGCNALQMTTQIQSTQGESMTLYNQSGSINVP